jgi:large subunit ribosomal protein L25
MEATLQANRRDTIGKNEARRTRRAGRVPAVVYGAAAQGGAREAMSIDVDPKALLRILHSDTGANTLISLKLGGEEGKVLVREYQLDPVSHAILHADFYRVAMDQMLQITVPIVVKGDAKGVKVQGGILEFVRREIEIEVLPSDIPEHIEVDVTELMVHDGIRVRDLPQGKWTPTIDADTMLVHVILPKAEESAATAEAAAAPAAASSEPEVIKKGKKEEEGAEKKDDKKK